ncbi:MAG: radical SAM/SPASM domain-containing protein [Thermodesulfobacteriota bacterium]
MKLLNKAKSLLSLVTADYRGVQIQTASYCNGRCSICPYPNSWHAEHPGVMDDGTFRRVVDQIKHFRIHKLCPYLENEPLADPKFFERLKILRDECNYHRLEVSTNGLLLNKRNAERLIEMLSGVGHEIWISFHGVDRQTYEELMGMPFEKVYHNVIEFLTLCDKAPHPMRIVIRGAGEPSPTNSDKQYFTEAQYQDFWDRTLRTHGISVRPKISCFPYHNRAGNVTGQGLTPVRRTLSDLRSMKCLRIDKWVHVLYTGELIICCMDYHKESVFGDVSRQTLQEVFSSRECKTMRAMAKGEVESPEDFICRRCTWPGE